jgi:hypothetical protein
MTANEMVKLLTRDFWCFDTFTETSKEFADQMAVKNALKHCYQIVNSDSSGEHKDKPYYQNKLGADIDFWDDVIARLETELKTFKN